MTTKAELRRALRVIAAAQKSPPPDLREKDRAELRSFLRVVKAMAKNPKTTAQLRREADDAEHAGHYARAAELYQAAIDSYPTPHPKSELAKHDLALLRQHRDDMRAAARAAARGNPCVPAPENLELAAASFRFGKSKVAVAKLPRAQRRMVPPAKAKRKVGGRRRASKTPLLDEIRSRGGIAIREARSLWGKHNTEGAPRGVFTRKGLPVDKMAMELGAAKWLSAPLGADQIGELENRLRAEVHGQASPHPYTVPDPKEQELDEIIAAARSGNAEAQAELDLRGVAWNPKGRRRNPHLLTIAGNPARIDRAALAAYRKFHGVDPKSVVRVGKGSGVLVALGDLIDLVYKPHRGERRGPAWIHRFGKGAVLAATPDGSKLFIVDTKGKRRMVDWHRGIVR